MICFLTGSTGFLGKNIATHLVNEGHETISPGRDEIKSKLVSFRSIDLFIHAAGKAHSTKKSKEEVKAFFDVNFDLTKKITEVINQSKVKLNTFVFISTVSVYGLEEGLDVDETAPLNANSPYAQSKRLAEEHLQKWAKESGVNLVILRLPLIFGENAPGNLGAMERAVKGRYYFQIGKGKARRSMIRIEQLVEFIPTLVGKSGIYNLSDGYHPTYAEVAEYFGKKHKKSIKSLSLRFLKPIAKIGDILPQFPLNSYRLAKLTQSLTFSDQKARVELEWGGTNVLSNQISTHN